MLPDNAWPPTNASGNSLIQTSTTTTRSPGSISSSVCSTASPSLEPPRRPQESASSTGSDSESWLSGVFRFQCTTAGGSGSKAVASARLMADTTKAASDGSMIW